MKVLVTGGAGFIGSNLVRALLDRGDEVRVLDNFATGSRDNLVEIENDVDIFEGDLRSYERVHNAVRGVEVIYHQGALPSVPRSLQDPLTTSAVNVEGTLNVLLAARDEGVRRVVAASSSSVYGSSGSLPRIESAPIDPIAPYAVAKLAAERYCVSFARVYDGFEAVCLRYFNVFGPRQDPRSQYAAVVPLFATRILAGQPVPINGDGGQSRDFTYIDNVIDANIRASEVPGASGQVFNVATGNPVSVDRIADMLGEIAGRPVEKDFRPPRPGDVRDSWADLTAIRDVLGWTPAVDLEEGLRRTVDALSASPAAVAD
jgi:UDP-glucose 4-epimerase